MNICPHLPLFQLEFGQGATFPFIEASNFGILGLDGHGNLQFTSHFQGKKAAHAAFAVNVLYSLQAGIPHVADVSFVTDFDVSCDEDLYSGNLEQIAYAFPNLQRLNFEHCFQCLSDLRGLRMIAKVCKSLQGLNLLHILSMEVESCTKLWKILSKAKLTHLALECCILFKHDVLKATLVSLYQRFVNLKALECHNSNNIIPYNSNRLLVMVLSHFPSPILQVIQSPLLGCRRCFTVLQ